MPQSIPTTGKLKTYWNAAATKPFRHPLPPSVLSHFRASGKVLDFGCGTGRLSGVLASAGFEVSGSDSSVEMLEQARSNLPDCDFRPYEGHLPWENDYFDAIILVALLTSVPNREDQAQVISEATRVLKDGGHVFVSDLPLQWSDSYCTRYEAGMKKYGDFGVFDLPDGGVVRHHDLGYFLQLLSPFHRVLMESHEVTTMNGNQATAIRYLGRLPS